MSNFPLADALLTDPGAPTLAQRLAMRERPVGTPIMRQEWDELLFLHWPVPGSVSKASAKGKLDMGGGLNGAIQQIPAWCTELEMKN